MHKGYAITAFGVTLMAALLASASAFAETFFSMDHSAAADPNAGWSAEALTQGPFTRRRVAGGGPSGQDAYDLIQYYDTSFRPEFWGGQFRWGWSGYVEPADPPRGASRFYRFRIRFDPSTNFRGLGWGDGLPSGMTNKLLLIGDGGTEAPSRVIIEYTGRSSPIEVRRMRLQIDGGANISETGPWPVGTWLNVQIEARSSTTSTTSNGALKIWVNNNSYSAPTGQYVNMVLNPSFWRYVRLGGYNSHGLASDGVHAYRHTDFQASTTFDPNWHSNGSTTPTAPTEVTAQ